MALLSKHLYYQKNGSTYALDRYSNVLDMKGEPYHTTRDSDNVLGYTRLATSGNSLSDLYIQQNGITYRASNELPEPLRLEIVSVQSGGLGYAEDNNFYATVIFEDYQAHDIEFISNGTRYTNIDYSVTYRNVSYIFIQENPQGMDGGYVTYTVTY